jgi:hypothetical protein
MASKFNETWLRQGTILAFALQEDLLLGRLIDEAIERPLDNLFENGKNSLLSPEKNVTY